MGLLLLLFSAVLQPAAICAEAPAAEKLLTAAIEAQRVQDRKGWKYTWREDEQEFQFNKKGERLKPKRKTFDVIMLEGENYRKLILENGKPLSKKLQKQVDREMEEARGERKKRRLLSLARSVSLGGLDELNRLFDNKVTGEEVVRGRNAWRIESTPKKDLKPATKQDEEAMSTLRATWIDQQELAVVKERHTFLRAANSFQPGTQYEKEYVKVEGTWLPDLVIWKGNMKALAVIHARFETHRRDYDYKRFNANPVQ